MTACYIVLIGSLLTGQAPSPATEDLNAEVARLVRRLDAPQLARREAAEADLVRRGPAILPLLPDLSDRTPAEVRQRLGRVRQKLERLAADAVAEPSTITLKADAMPLSKVLAELQRQSTNPIVDRRPRFGQPATDPPLKVDFQQTPFWPALDRVLDEAGLAVYPFSEQRAIEVVAALGGGQSPRIGRACYRGPFRFEPLGVTARRDLRRAADEWLVVTVEVAWEPRLRPINLVARMADVAAVDDRGNPLPAANPDAQLESSAGGESPALKLDLPLRLPPRTVERIASLKGRLVALIPGKMETFRFRDLASGKPADKRIAAATVTLESIHKAATVGRDDNAAGSATAWEIRIRLRFDDAGDALASHRTWIFNNPAYLEGPDGKPIAYESYETTAQSKNEVGLAYLVRTDRPLDELTFVYKAPGTIITRGFDYELKDIKLP